MSASLLKPYMECLFMALKWKSSRYFATREGEIMVKDPTLPHNYLLQEQSSCYK